MPRTKDGKPVLYKPFKSDKTPASKKFSVYVKANNSKGYKIIHFGDSSMQDFRQHKDEKRRASYLARAKGIKDKNGNHCDRDWETITKMNNFISF